MKTIDLAPSAPKADKAAIYYTVFRDAELGESWIRTCRQDSPEYKVLVDKHEIIPVAYEQLNSIYAERAQAALANQAN